MGQWEKIRNEPSGAPAAEWYVNTIAKSHAQLTVFRIHTVPNNGIIRYLGFFNQERLLVTSVKGMAELLTTKSYDFRKPDQITRGIGRILGIGLLLAEADVHRAQRKSLMPAFAFRHIKDLYPILWSKSKESALSISMQIDIDAGKPKQSDLEKGPIAADQAVMEVGTHSSRATLDIIGVAGLGRDFHAIADPNTELYRTYSVVFMPSRQAQVLGLLNLFMPHWFVRRLPIKRNGEVEAAAKVIRKTCSDLIMAKKEKLEKKELTDVDILSVALESGVFDEENLVNQLMTFMAAGHETTAAAMIWAIYMLCLHPEIQTRLRAEIRAKLPSVEEDKEITSFDIDHMPYLNAVCSEVLRYYPPVPMTVREAAVDTSICGEYVPKGTTVFIAPWATNRDKALWGEDADKFVPERWITDGMLNASGGATSNYANETFLHGPRSCIGQAFARAEFACLLAAWIGRHEFELLNAEEMDEKKLVIKAGVTTRPAKGMWVKVRVVDGW
jgi:cytochrome P450